MPIIKLFECMSCTKSLDSSKEFFFCDKCSRPQHATCAGLNRHEIVCLKNSNDEKRVVFICTECEREKQDFANVFNLVESLRNDFENLKKMCTDKFKESPISNSKPEAMENVIGEMNERAKRASNILIFNIPETTHDDRVKHDEEEVDKLLNLVIQSNHIPATNLPSFKAFRLGKPTPQKIRPLKVVFSSPSIALNILSQKKFVNLPNSISISSDRTQSQRDYMQHLRSELEERQKTEDNLIIKYINSVPKIVKNLKNSHLPIAQ